VTTVAVREPLDLLTRLEREGKATPTALILTDDLDFDSYEALGRYLGALRDATAWWIGDWLIFGEFVYGEKYAQAVEATGRSKQTLKNYAWVASKVPASRRKATLSWSHHEAIAKLDPREQRTWLGRAEKQGWSIEELRGAMRELETIEATAVPTVVELSSGEALTIARMVEDEGGDHPIARALADRLKAAGTNGRVVVEVGRRCPTCNGTGRAK